MKKHSGNVTRRGLLVGAGALAATPAIGHASTGAVADVAPASETALAKVAATAAPDLSGQYRQVFLQLRDLERRLQRLVKDALERESRFDISGRDALTLFDIAKAELPLRYPPNPYVEDPENDAEAMQLRSLQTRGYISIRRGRVTLRKKGLEVARFISERCIHRLDPTMRAILGEHLPKASAGLVRLGWVFKDVVLYRL